MDNEELKVYQLYITRAVASKWQLYDSEAKYQILK